jgi:hypothetical protein
MQDAGVGCDHKMVVEKLVQSNKVYNYLVNSIMLTVISQFSEAAIRC